jgi:hypothetical protein
MSKRLSLIAAGATLATLGANDAAQAITFGGVKVQSPSEYNGVAQVNVKYNGGNASCTGALLPGSNHLLTAAHCLTDRSGNLDVQSTSIHFEAIGGTLQTNAVDYYIYPGWDGFSGGDIAVLKLGTTVPSLYQQYDLYRERDEAGKIFTVAGYGKHGTGRQGATLMNDSNGSARARYLGKNRFDIALDSFGPINGAQLLFDFDDGTAQRDTSGLIFGITDPGLTPTEAIVGLGESKGDPNAIQTSLNIRNLLFSKRSSLFSSSSLLNSNLGVDREVMIAYGDSGGPSFINNKIAGINSYILSPGSPFDVDDQLNSTFGELAGVTRVSSYTQFVDDVVAGRITPTQKGQSASRPTTSSNVALIRYNQTDFDFVNIADVREAEVSVPEPTSALGLLAASVGGAGLLARKRKHSSESHQPS